jgi:hypothetical protein
MFALPYLGNTISAGHRMQPFMKSNKQMFGFCESKAFLDELNHYKLFKEYLLYRHW